MKSCNFSSDKCVAVFKRKTDDFNVRAKAKLADLQEYDLKIKIHNNSMAVVTVEELPPTYQAEVILEW